MSIEFENDTHRQAYEKIKGMMMELYGEAGATPHEGRPGWMLDAGSGLVHVSVQDWRDGMSLVQIIAYVVRGPELTPECLRFLLDENHTKAFGGFSVDSDADIAFSHALIAEFCTKDELRTVIGAVAFTADQMDDQIVQRWGGRRACD